LAQVEVDALVDIGATFPALPEDLITKLGLLSLGEHLAEAAEGTGRVELVVNAIIRVEDRIAQSPIIKRSKGTTPLIGVVALEQMGCRVDPMTGKLIKGLPHALSEASSSPWTRASLALRQLISL
jgi:predicted aspartyl protease